MAQSVAFLYFSYGILAGFGYGIIYLCTSVAVAQYFNKRRSLAAGLALCGNGVGIFVMSTITETFIRVYTWRGAILLHTGFILNGIVFALLLRPVVQCRLKQDKLKGIIGADRMDITKNPANDSFDTDNAGTINSRKDHINDAMFNHTNGIVEQTLGSSFDTYDISQTPTDGIPDTDTILRNTFGKEDQFHGRIGFSDATGCYHLDDEMETSYRNSDGTEDTTDNRTGGIKAMGYRRIFPGNKLYRHDIGPTSIRRYNVGLASGRRRADFHIFWVDGPNETSNGIKDDTDETTNNSKHDLIETTHAIKEANTSRTDDEIINSSNGHADVQVNKNLSCAVDRTATRITYLQQIRGINSSLSYPYTDRRVLGYIWNWWISLGHILRQIVMETVDVSLLKQRYFCAFTISSALYSIVYYTPFLFIPDLAKDLGIDEFQRAWLLSANGIMNTFSRGCGGWIADIPCVNRLYMYSICMIVYGVMTSFTPHVTSFHVLMVICIMYGILQGLTFVLTIVLVADIVGVDKHSQGFRLLNFFSGIMTFVGPPLAGWLYDITGTYNITFYTSGVLMSLSGLILFILPCIDCVKNRVTYL